MHIAIVAPLVSPIRHDYAPLGGAQALVADLAEGLVERGQRVTLLAADESFIPGADAPQLGIDSQRLSPADFSHPGPRTDTLEQVAGFRRVRDWLDNHVSEIDVAHGHSFDAPCFLALHGLQAPVMHTLHLPPIDHEVMDAARAVQNSASFVTVSQASAAQWRDQGVPIRRVIYPGLRLDGVPFREEPGTYLLFAGRVTPEKGTDQAIDIARSLNQPLIIAGDVYDREYFDSSIAPRVRVDAELPVGDELPTGVTYVGLRPRSELLGLMSRARAVLMPSTWDEPFGLVGIEAQATGTPVVAYRRGGLIEVVASGTTGWLVTPGDRSEFMQRVRTIDRIDRRLCRHRVEQQFSLGGMIDSYLDLYQSIGVRKGT
jgi:glycosyltransferase involved in cell wall biosynthesis